LINKRKNTREIGREGEKIALEFLVQKDYQILDTNYQKRCGELDIIAKTGNVVVFVEVKYRRSLRVSTPEESVTQKKRDRMIKTAETYIYEKGGELGDVNYRFDVVGIRKIKGETTISHYENVFILG